jgi:hypothetical protein
MAEQQSSPTPGNTCLPQQAESQDSLGEVSNLPQLKRKRKSKPKGSKYYTKRVKVTINPKNKKDSLVDCTIVNKNMYLQVQVKSYVDQTSPVSQAFFMKKFFPPEDCTLLNDLMMDCDYWEPRQDCRGNRLTSITGTWNSRGRFRPGKDELFAAGKGGKAELQEKRLHLLLKKMGQSLSPLIERKRPDIFELLQEHKLLNSDFGIFPLFMSPRGGCGIHNDPNDLLSVVVSISTPSQSGFFSFFFFLFLLSSSFLN